MHVKHNRQQLCSLRYCGCYSLNISTATTRGRMSFQCCVVAGMCDAHAIFTAIDTPCLCRRVSKNGTVINIPLVCGKDTLPEFTKDAVVDYNHLADQLCKFVCGVRGEVSHQPGQEMRNVCCLQRTPVRDQCSRPLVDLNWLRAKKQIVLSLYLTLIPTPSPKPLKGHRQDPGSVRQPVCM